VRCPVCKDSQLKMAERQGIEIDYCPDCRGVWLDRGELDKIIERSAQAEQAPAAAPPPRDEPRRNDDRRDDDRRDDYRRDEWRGDDDRHKDKRYRKRSLLGDLFDFD
jgi:uncharacterized protein